MRLRVEPSKLFGLQLIKLGRRKSGGAAAAALSHDPYLEGNVVGPGPGINMKTAVQSSSLEINGERQSEMFIGFAAP